MKTINNPKIYSMPSRIVHWVMALLLTINILIGFLFDQISPAFKQFLLPLHQILGICLIGLFFVSLLICLLIKTNNYFSRNNKSLTPQTITEQFLHKK